jgi:hypothetical protein
MKHKSKAKLDSSFDSDNEFWKEYEDPSRAQGSKQHNQGSQQSNETFYKSLGKWASQKVQDQLNSLRKSAQDELVSQRIAVRQETKVTFTAERVHRHARTT